MTPGSSRTSCSEQSHIHQPRVLSVSFQRIPQRPAEALEMHLHDISRLQMNSLPKAEGVRAEEVDVNISGPTMPFELEVVMLQIGQRVRHGLLAATDGSRPQSLA